LRKADFFQSDINRIFSNAKKFNGAHTELHCLAKLMHDKCQSILNAGRIKEIFETNAKITHDEL
jgi:hypothetical protein